MSRSGGMSQLLKGMMIGIVLILAIIGTMSLLENNSSNTSAKVDAIQQAPTIEAPSISINSDNTNVTDTSINMDQVEAIKSDDDVAANTQTEDAITPVLENEDTEIEIIEEPEPEIIKYGLLKLSAINPDSKKALKVNFSIFDIDDKKVAENFDTDNTSHRLTTGKYKIVTTLSNTETETGQNVPTVQKTQYVTILADTISNQVFELEPPPTIGILQVSAISSKADKQAMRANFIVQKENGETVATRNNVTNSLFKLEAGSYKVTVKSGGSSDFRSIVVTAGESVDEVFKLQETFSQGRVLVRIFDTQSDKAINADITVSNADGNIIQESKSVTQSELSLVAGDYKIQVTGPYGQSNRKITVSAGQALNEIFRFDVPQQDLSNQGTKITDNITIKGIENQQETTPEEPINKEDDTNSKVNIFARNAVDQRPLKSNIYIQTPSGKHLVKKIYVEKAEFNLAPGTYKVTVRSKDRANTVKTIQVFANQNVSETFLLQKVGENKLDKRVTTPTLAPPKPAKNSVKSIIPNGFLNVSMQPINNQAVTKGSLNTHFIVANSTGKKVVELTSVSSANFKLDTGIYTVTAIHKSKRQSKRVTIRENQNTKISFNSGEFQTRKGILRSRVIDESGRPLKADLTVTNTQGQVVARARGVSTGVFDLPASQHTISVSYRGLNGSEIVKIAAGKTTVQTFTIAPNRTAPSNTRLPQTNNSNDVKKILRDKIKEQIQKQF